MTEIDGRVEPGWEAVAVAFRQNFDEHGDLGAACAVYADGHAVVDLWGGVAHKASGRRWERDTVALAMSTTKGATALIANRLAQLGELDLDAPVATYWPEFAANGKDAIPVRWLLTHQAGLPVIETSVTLEEACAWTPVIRELALQRPLWEPGRHYGYHAFTFGYLIGEVIRRATGRTVGEIFAEDVAQPLKLDAWIGLPDEVDGRVAMLEPAPEVEIDDPQLAALLAKAMGPDSVMARSLTLGGAVPPGFVTESGGMNARNVRASEWPAANLVTDARSIAKLYAATVGEVDGVRLLPEEALDDALSPQTDGQTPFGVPAELSEAMTMRFGLGYMLPSPAAQWLSPSSFGHPGAGGALGFGDREFGIGFGYVMNQMQLGVGDPRTLGLIDAVRSVTAGQA